MDCIEQLFDKYAGNSLKMMIVKLLEMIVKLPLVLQKRWRHNLFE